jgi:arginase
MLGDDRHPASAGPQALVGGDARRVERKRPFADSATASLAVNGELARIVREAVAAGELPLVTAGSCDASLGILAGLDDAGCGVVWVDAHADFNTPESTVSGFFAGMSLAIVTGHCYRSYWARIGGVPVSEAATLLLGVRDLSPAEERERLERSAIRTVPWRDGRPEGDVQAALDDLAGRVDEVYLHIDLDGLDPEVAPGIVDEPVPGGLSRQDVEDVVRGVAERFRLRAVALTTYNPERDREGRTLRVARGLVELVTECAAATPR